MGAERGRAYGLLLDNSWRTTFDIGNTHERELRFGAARSTTTSCMVPTRKTCGAAMAR